MSYVVNEVNILINKAGRQLTLDNGHQRAVLSAKGRGMAAPTYFTDDGMAYAGQRVSGFRFGARTIELVITDTEKTRSDYHSLRDSIIRFLRPNQGEALTLRHMRKGAVRDIQVYVTNPIFDDEHTRGSKGFTQAIQFLAPDPFFYDPIEKTIAINDKAVGGFGFPFGFPFGFLPSAFTGKTLNYQGSAESYPRITVKGPFSTLTITNQTRGINLYINRSLGDGRLLTIDLNPRNISMWDDIGNDYLNASGSSDLVNFYLQPGINIVSAAGAGYTAATEVTFFYYERYLGL